jgi:hypothetical protein
MSDFRVLEHAARRPKHPRSAGVGCLWPFAAMSETVTPIMRGSASLPASSECRTPRPRGPGSIRSGRPIVARRILAPGQMACQATLPRSVVADIT